MSGLIELLKQRRLWVAALPVVVMIANAVGVQVTESMLTDTADKVLAGVMAALALWSFVHPKA